MAVKEAGKMALTREFSKIKSLSLVVYIALPEKENIFDFQKN
jgi:hypothetical protein